ncbi:unnamed protein product [Pleuronectes platessa]|uniref:Uncharacterized protein n=1 Tax=Pleuronectes platessa TaxID=8262 RepID=A0A9N7TS98_PLEPL|nr:unnamed protein product [Pleuronectes platessa]
MCIYHNITRGGFVGCDSSCRSPAAGGVCRSPPFCTVTCVRTLIFKAGAAHSAKRSIAFSVSEHEAEAGRPLCHPADRQRCSEYIHHPPPTVPLERVCGWGETCNNIDGYARLSHGLRAGGGRVPRAPVMNQQLIGLDNPPQSSVISSVRVFDNTL